MEQITNEKLLHIYDDDNPLINFKSKTARYFFILAQLNLIWCFLGGDTYDFLIDISEPEEDAAGRYIKITLPSEHDEKLLKLFKDDIEALSLFISIRNYMNKLNEDPKEESPVYLAKAFLSLGMLSGLMAGKGMNFEKIKQEVKSELAKKGSSARHAENRSMKKQLFEWCDEKMTCFKSMDSAAEAVAGKILPVSFRTARSWIGEWKKIRFTSKV